VDEYIASLEELLRSAYSLAVGNDADRAVSVLEEMRSSAR
jgi:hypothetical protein